MDVDLMPKSKSPVFIDAFAGCGGLSLGLMKAGWRGLFAIEKDRFAFKTLQANLLESRRDRNFLWPSWLPKEPHCITSLLENYRPQLQALQGTIDLLAGGPPCQGFSSAGRRNISDPRNKLMLAYLNLVNEIQPRVVLLENVHGITVGFKNSEGSKDIVNYAEVLLENLGKDYDVYWKMIDASEFGVPQARIRFFLLGLRREGLSKRIDPFNILEDKKWEFLRSKELLPLVSASIAISDLEEVRNGRVISSDSPGYEAIAYHGPKTHYQRLMRDGFDGQPSNTRLAKHRHDIVERFKKIISICHADGRLNISIGREMREAFGLKKQALRVLDPDRPSPTITSMPDDLLHYSEPRTLTVRENARLQSFPDWFDFQGKYTTGGHLRRKEVPRFTQVANAVPPLLAEAFGLAIQEWLTYSMWSDFKVESSRELSALA